METTRYLACALVSFVASIAGAICGIGGGILIKPLLDAVGMIGPSAASYLSSCTVLSMACVSVASDLKSKSIRLDIKHSTPLAIGSAIGGFAGKIAFDHFRVLLGEKALGVLQAEILLFVTLAAFLYTLFSARIKKLHVSSLSLYCIAGGIGLGSLSSFLGIGGGPVNLIALSFLFDMDAKTAALNSLYIITISQAVSVSMWIYSGIPNDLNQTLLIFMIACGFLGGLLGRMINKNISERSVRMLFLSLMVIITGICFYNI